MSRFRLEEMRDMAKAVFLKAVSAVDPYQRLKEIAHIDKNRLIIGAEEVSEKVFDLNEFERIFLVGTGKASSSMAQAIEEIFGGRITKGLITTKYGHALPLRFTEIIEAGHPLPDPKGLEGARKIKDLLTNTGPKDLVLFLISGGGSALMPLPADKITLEEKQELTQLLLDCGADIKEINTIRKHISQM
ncbi:MAG: glycerate-2-kinase family protein, partial [Deltaproteobacteria bacterium]|nr:glycerate-2-kinase family protein [Deltaproteobacteria bacterium]